MSLFNKCLFVTLALCILGVLCVGVAMTDLRASITVSFGKQPVDDPRLVVMASQMNRGMK